MYKHIKNQNKFNHLLQEVKVMNQGNNSNPYKIIKFK